MMTQAERDKMSGALARASREMREASENIEIAIFAVMHGQPSVVRERSRLIRESLDQAKRCLNDLR